ncbi:MAG: cation diffusion facilitator family transporter [Eubacterium sp.]|nr:cation diffusion facilitator family transporter [Eubacterium sp.]
MDSNAASRKKVIIRTSVIGIIANLFLAGFKAFVGLVSGSIAVVLDAVNNLSDALSSVVTIIGTVLGNKAPDKKHPMGHGRTEYLSQMIVAAIVLYAGATSLIESVKKIIEPTEADYSTVSLVIIASAIVVKLVLGFYVKKKGQEVNSGALIASGADAGFDAILSASVLASALIFIFTGIGLEAYVGVIISIVIIKSGIEMILEAVDDVLGIRVESELTKEIKKIVSEETIVNGAYDLLLHNYGPDRFVGSVHVEVADYTPASEIDAMTRRIQKDVLDRTGVVITTVGIYSKNTGDDAAARMGKEIEKIVMSHDGALQVHGFYVDLVNKTSTFDVVLDFRADRRDLYEHICNDISEAYPEFDFNVALDVDVSD